MGSGLDGQLVRTPTPDAFPPIQPGAVESGGAGAPGMNFHLVDWKRSSWRNLCTPSTVRWLSLMAHAVGVFMSVTSWKR